MSVPDKRTNVTMYDTHAQMLEDLEDLSKRLEASEKGRKAAEKYIQLLATHLISKRLGKLGLHQNNQKSFAAYKELLDILDLKGWLCPARNGPYSQRLLREKHVYDFEEYMKSNWRESYTKCIDRYSRTGIVWRRG
jgi:hypothetical protein